MTGREGSSSSTSSPHPHWFYSSEKDTWVTFPPKDNEALEAKWNELGGKEWWLKQRDDRRKEEEEEEEAKEREKEEQKTKDQRQKESKSKDNEEQDEDEEESPASGSYWTGVLRTWFNVGSLDDLSTSSSPSDPPPSDEKKSNIKQEEEQEATMIEEIVDPSEPESARRLKVAVLEDRLFDVDVANMTLYPVFFKGVLFSVIRSEWFYWSEMEGQYSPIRWESDLSRDLERTWQEGRAWELSTTSNDDDQKEKKDSSTRKETDLMDIRSEESEGKGKVKFISPVEGKVFTEDIRGRFVSLIGGSTVIRGFDEVERRTGVDKDRKKRRGFFGGMPDLPTMSKPWASKEETLDNAASSSGKAGAAQPDNQPPQSAGHSKGKQGDVGGFAGKLIPSTDRWWARPTMTFLNAFGLSGGEGEAQRSQQQTNTEKAVDVDGTKNDQAKQGDGDKTSDAESQDDDDIEGAVDDESKSAEQLDPCDEEDVDDEDVEDQVHLVLCVHGIGQGLRDDFESLDFTYDVQKLRKLSQQRIQEEGIHSLVHSTRIDADGKTIKIRRRVQYIPICWRRSLDLAYHPEENDNHFDLADVTNTSIDFIRNVVSKVVLDVPFYLSPVYKPMMVKAVTEELNRIYRLWIRRNPDWLEKGGKVSLISHSLGSCLSADILARQPTFVSPISDLSNEEIRQTSGSRLHFNVQDLYLVGSPLGLFLLLSGSQLIARSVPRNEAYESSSARPSSLDEEGKEGCMAIHGSLYNVYNDSDPVAYRCNAAVDSRYAKLLRPVPLPGAVNAIVDSLKAPRLQLLGFFDKKEPFKSLKEKWDSSQEGRKRATKGMDKEKVKEATATLRRYAKTHDRATIDGGKDKGKDTASDDSDDYDEDRKRRTTPQRSGLSSPVRLEKGSQVKETLLPELALKKEKELREAQKSSTDEDKQDTKSSEPKKTSLSHLESASSRFLSLNRHGAIDFFYTTNPTNNSFLTSSGLASSWGEYVSMLSAHNGYWTSPSVVGLVLTQILGGEQEREEERKQQRQRGKEDSVTLVPSVGTTR